MNKYTFFNGIRHKHIVKVMQSEWGQKEETV